MLGVQWKSAPWDGRERMTHQRMIFSFHPPPYPTSPAKLLVTQNVRLTPSFYICVYIGHLNWGRKLNHFNTHFFIKEPASSMDNVEAFGKGSVWEDCPELNHSE